MKMMILRKVVLLLAIALINGCVSSSKSSANQPKYSKEMQDYALKVLSGTLIDSLRSFTDATELASKNPRYNFLYKKHKATSLSKQETEEAEHLLTEYTCKKYHKEFDQTLTKHGKDLVIIGFEDLYCERCTAVNLILDRISKKYRLQLDIIKPDNLNTYLKSNGLDGETVDLLVQEFNNENLKINILKEGNIPVFVYNPQYGWVFPLVYQIGNIKKDCDIFASLASFAKYNE